MTIQVAFTDRLLNFSAEILKLATLLSKSYVGRHVGNQLMRAATSAGANWEETCGAQSRADYAHKMQIVLKELRESSYWLKLLKKSNLPIRDNGSVDDLSREAIELTKIIGKSVVTVKKDSKA